MRKILTLLSVALSFVVGFALTQVARFIPSALDRALRGLNEVEVLLAAAATKAQTRIEAEAAKRNNLNALVIASHDAEAAVVAELERATRIRERINALIA